jgi:hypothetical protein
MLIFNGIRSYRPVPHTLVVSVFNVYSTHCLVSYVCCSLTRLVSYAVYIVVFIPLL